MINGFDASNNNGAMSWTALGRSGYAYDFLKAVEGATLKDGRFQTNARESKARGKITGAYGFARPSTSTALAEANAIMDCIEAAGGVDFPPMLDFEDFTGLDAKSANEYARTWHDGVQKRWRQPHRRLILYCNSAELVEYALHGVADVFELFVADYVNAAEPDTGKWPRKWKFWQHTQTGTIPGTTGYFDLDIFNGTLNELHSFASSGAVKDPAYKHFTVNVGGHEFDAIGVPNGHTDVTHVLYTAVHALGGTVENKSHDGTLIVDSKPVVCVVDGGQDYVPWFDLAPKVNVHKIGGEFHFSIPTPQPTPPPQPETVNLWQWHGPIHNQLNQGACTGEATVGTREWYEVKHGTPIPFVKGAPEAAYAWARIAEGSLARDAGAGLRDALLSLVEHGMAPAGDDVLDSADEFAAPSAKAVADAAPFKIKGFNAVSFGGNAAAVALRDALAAGNPVPVAFTFNTAFYSPTPQGVVDYTKGTTQPTEGHAFIILGYGPASVFGVKGYTGTLYAAQNSWDVTYGVKLPGTDTAGFMLLTEETVNNLLFNAYTLDVPQAK